MSLRRSSRRAAAALMAGMILAGACSGGNGTPSTANQNKTVPAAPGGAPSPLTGRPPADPATLQRPVLAVKVDNAPAARPQAGLDRADVVVEELVEGGVVRFMALFQSQDSPSVGPVRSVRPLDGTFLASVGGYFSFSGGNDAELREIRKAPITLVGIDELTAAYTRRRDRPSPHNLYTSTQGIYSRGRPASGPPPALFDYRAPGAPFEGAGAAKVAGVDVRMGERTQADWAWDGAAGVFRRSTNGTPHAVEGGGQLGFANVVIQFVRYVDRPDGETDRLGFAVPDGQILGQGEAWVLSGSTLIKGRWSRPDARSVTSYTDSAGAPLKLAPGATWLMLAPIGAPVTVR